MKQQQLSNQRKGIQFCIKKEPQLRFFFYLNKYIKKISVQNILDSNEIILYPSHKMKIKKAGFTLIELLVVIVIIGILATVSIPIFKGQLVKARDSKRISAIHNIGVGMIASISSNQDTPPYDAIIDGSTPTTLTNIQDILEKQTIEIIPSQYGHEFWYFSEGADFIIAVCSEEISGSLIHSGTSSSFDHIECTTNNKIPTAITAGRFDGGVNFQLVP